MTIYLGVSKADALVQLKSELLTNLGVPVAGEFELSLEPSLSPPLLAFLRINSMTEGTRRSWKH